MRRIHSDQWGEAMTDRMISSSGEGPPLDATHMPVGRSVGIAPRLSLAVDHPFSPQYARACARTSQLSHERGRCMPAGASQFLLSRNCEGAPWA